MAITRSPCTDPAGADPEAAPANLADALTRQAARTPAAPAVDVDGRVLAFQALESLVWKAAAALAGAGVRRGDVVAMACARPLPHLVSMLAVARLGATVLSIPSSAPHRQVLEQLDAAVATVLLRDAEPSAPAFGERPPTGTASTGTASTCPASTDTASTGPASAALAGHACVADALDAPDAFSDCRSLRLRLRIDLAATAALPASACSADLRDPAPRAPWLIITGSGSTGRSKLIPVTHAQYLARMALARAWYAPAGERVLSLVGLDFASAKNLCLEVLFAGGAVVLVERPGVDLATLCRLRQVTVVWASVVHLEQMLAVYPEAACLLPGVRRLYVGSSTVGEGLRRRVLQHVSPNLHVRYGTNESGVIAIATPDMLRATAGTVGRPVDGVTVELVDAHGRPVPDGAVGQVRVRSAAVFDGYPDDPDANRRVFDGHGFRCGDLARRTSDGQLVYCGRADQMMIMDGINIYPAEIERVLGEHPAVADVVALPLHSTVHQDIPVAAVALHAGAAASEDTLRRFASERLGPRAPRRVLVLDAIPRNPQGKVARGPLAKAIEACLSAAAGTRPAGNPGPAGDPGPRART